MRKEDAAVKQNVLKREEVPIYWKFAFEQKEKKKNEYEHEGR
jgi:hypothetical protein